MPRSGSTGIRIGFLRLPGIVLVAAASFALSACYPAKLAIEAQGKPLPTVLFYPGGSNLDDLLIVGGVNYFGKAQYQIDDPLSDIGFRLNDGRRIQAECVKQGKEKYGDKIECKRYRVYRSSFAQIPVGAEADKPSQF